MKKHTLKDIVRALVAEYLTDDGKPITPSTIIYLQL